MFTLYFATIAVAVLAELTTAASSIDWATKSIYQVMTDRFARSNGSTEDCDVLKYCGGSWVGLIDRLDYIQGMGFSAVQISPVVENLPQDTPYGEAYHGYWQQNLYELNSNFGTAGDLSHLASELHSRGMYLMVDVVINDMAIAIPNNGNMTENTTIDYSLFTPFNDQKYFHSFCEITDYNNDTNAQDCWFGVTYVALPDLDTESSVVVTMMNNWINQLVSNYSIDGLRIDAAKHVNNGFLPPFVEAAGVFTLGEVWDGDPEYVCKYQTNNLVAGLPNFPIYFPLIQAFTAGNMTGLSEAIAEVNQACNNTAVLGTFAENHDLPRFASLVDDLALASNAIAFTILGDGIPTMYQGQEQHMKGNYSPYNRAPLWTTNYETNSPLYNLTATLNTIRNHAISIDSHYATNHSTQLYLDNSTMATRKGPEGVQIVAVFSNQGSQGGAYELNVPQGFASGTAVMEITNCTKTSANEAGNITALMGAGLPKVFFPIAHLNGSGLCGFAEESVTTNATATKSSGLTQPTATQKGTAARTLYLYHPSTVVMGTTLLFACAFFTS